MKHFTKLALLSLFFMTGCGTTSHITSSWRAVDVQPKEYKKIVVLGLIRDADKTLREKMEQHIVDDLKELGYNAVCSCEEYNPKAFENMSEKDAIAKLRNSGVDAVLTVTLLDKAKEKYYVKGRFEYAPYNEYPNFYNYYRTTFERVYTPGYFVENTKYFWESNFYEMTSGQLLYSSQSQSFDPASSQRLSHEYGQMIVKDMKKNYVISDQKAPVLKPM
ncbi:MAG: hypothetical protein HOP10_02955 [Chitinophagaceae bacterium]|nr:hypothetical protein [Chitinophagaceae bacterium]